MDRRAAIPVTLPREHPTQSYWQLDPDEIADLRSTDTIPREAETIIIGSGITGAAVALNLLCNGAQDVVMFEARQACSGATGRNGGHTKAASYRSFLQHQQEHGTDAAVKIARLELANIRAVHAFANKHGIDCDSNPCETVDVVYDEKGWENDQRAVKALQDAMPGDDASIYRLHSAEEMRDKFYCGKGGYGSVCGGISYEAGSINSYKLVIGVLKLGLQRGLNLQTNTPVLKLTKRTGGGWLVETSRGTTEASRVVVATNGYTGFLLKKFQGVVVPLRGHVTAQRPGKKMPMEGLPTTYSFIYGDGYDYMIPRPKGSKFEGDIVIGGGFKRVPSAEVNLDEYGTTDDTSFNKEIIDTLHGTLPDYFGDNWGEDDPDGRIRKQWTGIMGYGADGLPFVGEMPGEKDLWVACSFQGHGMVLCWMCARALVAMMKNRGDEELRSWFPDVYRVTEARLMRQFQGVSHTGGADPSSLESK